MIAYILRRIVLAIPVMIGILFLTFLLSRLIPGDPCRAMLGEKATKAVCDAFIERTGLNQPIPVQFVYYFGRAVTGDLGESLRFGRPVTDMLMERLPVTIELALLSLLVATIVGMTLGVVAAYWQNSPIDAITMIFANLGVSVPIFVLGLLAAYLFAVAFKDTPFALPPSGRLQPGLIVQTIPEAWGMENLSGPPRTLLDFLSQMYIVNGILTLNWKVAGDAARHLILPVIVLATVPMSIIARMTRSSLLEVMTLDYVRTARAKGLNERNVVFRHAMRNSLLPVVTVGAAKASMGMKSPRKGGYDNHNPRQWEAGLTGWQQRANAAQANGFEALPLFIAAVLMAQQAQADQGVIDQWALAFIGIRLAYIASYLMDKAALRSLIWMAGVAVCIYIMSLAG